MGEGGGSLRVARSRGGSRGQGDWACLPSWVEALEGMRLRGGQGGGEDHISLLKVLASEPHHLGEAGEGSREMDSVEKVGGLIRGAEGLKLIEAAS